MNTLELIFLVPLPLILTSIIKPIFMNVFRLRSKNERTVIVCANIVSLIVTGIVAAALVNTVDEPIPMIVGGFLFMCLLEYLIYRIAFGKIKLLFLKLMAANAVALVVLALCIGAFFVLL